MAKRPHTKGMNAHTDRKRRGRTVITAVDPASPTRPNVPQVLLHEATRPVTGGGTKHRGDRRDTSPLYTGNRKHAAHAGNPRADVKTRKR